MTGQTHSYRIQEAAFDLFCAGHTRREVRDELAKRCGAAAPSDATLKRWSVAQRWVQRRHAITAAWRQRQDAQRGLIGADYLMELHLLRGKLLADARSLPMSSGEGACFALAALERVIARIYQHESELRTAAMFNPLLTRKLQELREIMAPLPRGLPRGDGITLPDGADDPNATPK